MRGKDEEVCPIIYIIMSQDEIIHVGGKECAHKGSIVEELWVGCDHRSLLKMTARP